MTPLMMGARRVGPGSPCLLIAEIGINHNGNMDLAHRSIDAAADQGADGVKFQNYRTEDFIADRALTYEYVQGGQKVKESQYDMFKRCELPAGALRDLRQHAAQRKVLFLSTPTGEEGVAELVSVGASGLKNGSDFLVNLPLVRAMARAGLPTILSTGMAVASEIDEAVRAFRDAGGKELALLHCVSAYPAPAADLHLRKIPTLASTFDCPSGLSDHSEGCVAALGSVALGASIIEKHFTLDRTLPGPDHRFSVDPGEWGELVRSVRILEQAMGSPGLGPTPSESKGRGEFRLSCVASRDLEAGHVLEASDIVLRRPSTGFPPGMTELLKGRRLARRVPSGHPFRKEDLA